MTTYWLCVGCLMVGVCIGWIVCDIGYKPGEMAAFTLSVEEADEEATNETA